MSSEKNNIKNGLELVVMRNQFYRDNYYHVLFCVLFMLVVNVFLACAVYYKWSHPPQPQYFATTADGRIIKIHPLNDPVLPDDMVLQWTADKVRRAFNLDYVHWREQLRDASNNFTSDGWHYFSAALQQTNNLKTLVDEKMVSDAQITGAPEVVREEVVKGHYAWNIKIPLLVTFSNKSNTIHMPINMTVIVLRMPVRDYPDRIAISNVFSQTVNASAYGD